MKVEENHQREQYFFDQQTLGELADLVGQFAHPCCLCTPMVGSELHRRGRNVRILDVDMRFAHLPGFVHWDIYRPTHLADEFDALICDPPFFNVSLSQLFRAIRILCHFDLSRRVMISYPVRREHAMLSVFAPFGLRATGYRPKYLTVQDCERNEIEFYANWDVAILGANVGSERAS